MIIRTYDVAETIIRYKKIRVTSENFEKHRPMNSLDDSWENDITENEWEDEVTAIFDQGPFGKDGVLEEWEEQDDFEVSMIDEEKHQTFLDPNHDFVGTINDRRQLTLDISPRKLTE